MANKFIADTKAKVEEIMKNPQKPVEGKVSLAAMHAAKATTNTHSHATLIDFNFGHCPIDGAVWRCTNDVGSIACVGYYQVLFGRHVLYARQSCHRIECFELEAIS